MKMVKPNAPEAHKSPAAKNFLALFVLKLLKNVYLLYPQLHFTTFGQRPIDSSHFLLKSEMKKNPTNPVNPVKLFF
jgi:hypothetical protein